MRRTSTPNLVRMHHSPTWIKKESAWQLTIDKWQMTNDKRGVNGLILWFQLSIVISNGLPAQGCVTMLRRSDFVKIKRSMTHR